MRCGEVGLGPLTPPFRLFPSVSKLKSIIITVCHLPNRANHTVSTLITDPCTKPTNILGHSWATLLLLSQVIFKVFTVSVTLSFSLIKNKNGQVKLEILFLGTLSIN